MVFGAKLLIGMGSSPFFTFVSNHAKLGSHANILLDDIQRERAGTPKGYWSPKGHGRLSMPNYLLKLSGKRIVVLTASLERRPTGRTEGAILRFEGNLSGSGQS